MKFQRVLIALGVMLVIVLLGLYWEGQRIPNPPSQQTSTQGSVETPDVDASDWDISPEATVSVRSGTRIDSPRTTGSMTIPGRVKFPEATSPEKLTLQVEILPLDSSQLQQLNTVESGNYEQVVDQLGMGNSATDRIVSQTITTDQNGHFSLRDAPVGLYRVRSLDERWRGSTGRSILQRNGDVSPVQFTVNRTASLVGYVVDPDQEPLSNARVSFMTSSRETTTDAKGQFRLSQLESGQPIDTVKITKRGFKTHYLDQPPLSPGESRHDTFVLQESSSVTVRVESNTGQPVTNGRIRLRRLDDPVSGSDRSPNNTRSGAMQSLTENGQVTFEDIAPGRFQIALVFSNHLAEPQTVELAAGESVQTTLTVQEGQPIEVRHVNAQTDAVVEEVRPRITVYDGSDQTIPKGFKFVQVREDGVLEGVVHPSAKRILIRSESNRFEPRETSLSVAELPEVTVELTPLDPRGSETEPPGLLKVNLDVGGLFEWENVIDAQAYVLNEETGQRVLGRAGHRSTFEEPFPLQSGRYVLYGLIRTDGGRYAISRSLQITSQHPGQETISPSHSGTITGRILINDEPVSDGVTVAVSLLEPESQRQAPTRDVYYPEQLTTTPSDNGEFRFKNVPPNRELGLHVVSEGGPRLGAQPGEVLLSRPISSLTDGEERSLSTINLEQ